jgi:hypothetical protein
MSSVQLRTQDSVEAAVAKQWSAGVMRLAVYKVDGGWPSRRLQNNCAVHAKLKARRPQVACKYAPAKAARQGICPS